MTPFYFFAAASLAMLLRQQKWASGLIGVALAISYFDQKISVIGFGWLLFLALTFWISDQFKFARSLRLLATFAGFAVAVGLFLHLLPGFENLLVANQVRLSPNAIPFTLYLNFDKTAGGLILWLLASQKLNRAHWTKLEFSRIGLFLALAILCLIPLALLTKFVKFEPHWHPLFFIWAANNLLFVCMSEEILFRGWVQTKMSQWSSPSLGWLLASLLFGVFHFKGGLFLILFATIAGLFYGYIFQQRKRVESSLVLHFSVNLIHFALFSYPALQH